MSKRTRLQQIAAAGLLLAGMITACFRQGPRALPTEQDIPVIVEETNIPPTKILSTSTPVPVEVLSASTSVSVVTVTAVKGNLFIRRGPDMAYNPVGILYKDTSAKVIAQDVLSDWMQIIIPGSQSTGWVSIQTQYSRVDGEVQALPNFTPTDWPIPAYLRNCTHHEMYILPGEITLPSSLDYPENEIWLYPGTYVVYDLEVADIPDVMTVDIREGVDIEIHVDGLGGKRKCP